MSSHFEVVGLPLEDRDRFSAWLQRVPRVGTIAPRLGGGKRYLFDDASGARAIVEVNESNDLQCINPSFRGKTSHSCQFVNLNRRRDCLNCSNIVVSLFDRDGAFATQLTVAHEDPAQFVDCSPGSPVTLGISAFVERADLFESEKQLSAAQDRGVAFATQSIMSINSLVPAERDGPARAFLTGKVLSSEPLTNADTGLEFTHATVHTFPWDIDVLMAPGIVPQSGAFIAGTFWLIARNI